MGWAEDVFYAELNRDVVEENKKDGLAFMIRDVVFGCCKQSGCL